MTTPHAGSVPEAVRHRPTGTPGPITVTAPDENRPRPFHDHTEQVERT
ncbi:hypothetical protein OG864_20955 [Streptomyces sp. NBC_00124]|nr:hypothetical protein [Streptomyces sp. NBC_00124]MCX5361181.1 hypothetical protein [Streptomyces sp. NBC_00124]